MQRFNYLNAKSNITNQNRSREEEARAKLQAERDAAQRQVDAVLYQEPERKKRPPSGGSSQSSQQTSESVETPVAKPAKVEEHPEESTPVNSEESKVYGRKKRVTRDEDDAVDSFENEFSASNEGDYEEPNDENNYESREPVRSVPAQKVQKPLSSGSKETPGDKLRQFEEADEIARRQGEDVLSDRIANSNKRNSSKPVQARRVNAQVASSGGTSVLKKFPTDLALHIQSMFPDANNMNDAVAAYVYLKEGKPDDMNVPDNIKDIAESYIGETVTAKDVQNELEKQLMQLQIHDRLQNKKLESIELALAYILFDRIGFRKKQQDSPGTIDFLESGVADLINRLETQSELKSSRDKQRNGRPIS